MAKDKDLVKLKNEFFASCPVGLELALEEELKALGIKETEQAKGGVIFTCFPQLALKSILYTKIASRIYKSLYRFSIKNEHDLYFRSKEIKWKSIFNLDQTFKIQTIQGNSPDGKKRSKFKSSIFLSQKFKDGIVDYFREKTNKRPDVDTTSPDASLLLRVTPHDNEFSVKEEVSVLIDLCGTPLSNRGYRQRGFAAPLRENLAAGVISIIKPNLENGFVDLMTGSGTVAIEACLYYGQIPGGYLQVQDFFDHQDEFSYNFLYLNFYTKDKYLKDDWQKIIDQAYKDTKQGIKKLEKLKGSIIANELDKRSLRLLEGNIQNALLGDIIDISNEDATQFTLERENLTLFANPPYGERLGDDQDLEKLYYELGENLKKNFRSSTAYIFTGNLPLIKKISLQTSKRVILFNGNIDSRLVEYKLF